MRELYESEGFFENFQSGINETGLRTRLFHKFEIFSWMHRECVKEIVGSDILECSLDWFMLS